MGWVLGLDVSTKTGWVAIDAMGSVECGEKQFKSLKGIARVDAFLGFTVELCETYAPVTVYIEGYGYANKHSLVTLVEIGTAIRLALHSEGITPVEVAPNVLKKYATGKGNAQKDQIMLAVYKKWGFEAETNNIADAFVLAQMAADSTW